MGTWTLPQTKQQAEKLSKLLEKTLPLNNLENKLYDLIGDDDLFDKIVSDRKVFGGKHDCSDEVKDFLRELIERYETSPEEFTKPFEPEALEILKTCLKQQEN